jgi:glutamate--cysteine ligase
VKYTTPGYEDLELSMQLLIKEALERGHQVEVLDRAESFVRITGNNRVEYIRQATRTSADTYIAPLVMENKQVTKQILWEAGLRVPEGSVFGSEQEMLRVWPEWKDRAFVVKPNATNFGTAVSMFPRGADRNAFVRAVRNAFAVDGQVLLEALIPGKEYRFLVIGDFVRAVLHRVPANVTGDGTSTIRALVEEKNRNPLRQKGYISPLEKIGLGPVEETFLAARDLTFESVPQKGETVFLRENSNISTGGDSIDFTDEVHAGYKDLAFAAASAVGARISGVDLIATDITIEPDDTNYAIIELNFNPALHIHDFPYKGKNRRTGRHVLNLLGL